MPTPNTPELSPAHEQLNARHQEDLEARAISIDLAVRAGHRSVDAEEMERHLGFKVPSEATGRLIPYDKHYARVRLDDPEVIGMQARYLSPKGLSVPLYLVPGQQYDTAPRIYVVESADKALALCGAGYTTVGLAGVTTTREAKRARVSRRLVEAAG
ncbi:MAG: DUF3854 domain-containing protein [Sandaracinaceae bacterium]|nr:DUF3854 domain-containing protein [Sandaracinaceae bacterium]